MRQCTHVRRGIVTNQPDGYDPDRPHASRTVCARPACVDAAMFWVAGTTNEPAAHVPDKEKHD